jgi:hypothetical protein
MALLGHIDRRIRDLKSQLDVDGDAPGDNHPDALPPVPPAATPPRQQPAVMPQLPPLVVPPELVPLTQYALRAHTAGDPLPTPSTPGGADSGSMVLCMIHKLATVLRELVDGLRLRLGGMRTASRQVLETGIRELTEADVIAGMTVGSGPIGGAAGPLNALLTDAVTAILATAREVIQLYRQTKDIARTAANELQKAHARVMQTLDGIVDARTLRDHAACSYQLKRSSIQPRVHARYVQQTAELMEPLHRQTSELCTRAPHYAFCGSHDLAQQFRLAIRTLADIIRSVQ